MKSEQEQIKLAITFNKYESKLIREAAKIMMPMHVNPCLPEGIRRKDFRRIVMLAVYAFCRGVIKEGAGSDYPGVAEVLRAESKDELERRIKNELPRKGRLNPLEEMAMSDPRRIRLMFKN